MLERAIREVLTVARAHGAAISNGIVKQLLASLYSAPASAIGNLRDIVDDRPSELETEIGAIVRLGKAAGVQVPCHAFLYASLLPQERKARGEIEFTVAEGEAAKAGVTMSVK
jgi:2-dehydropantoate 2-reductase